MRPKYAWNRAATSGDPFPGVEQAMIEGLHAPPSARGSFGKATADRIQGIRGRAARLFGFSHPDRVIFVPGCTWGLNLAVHGAVRPGHVVLTTALEHNALSRPLEAARRAGAQVEVLPIDASGRMRLETLEARLRLGGVDWLAFAIASNVLGTVEPFAEACVLARAHGARILLDLAQGGGSLPLRLDDLGVSYAAVSGHKGLHGPRGIGLLFVGPQEQPETWVQGGTGTEGMLIEMPRELPQRLEPGTANYPGIFGLGAALEWLERHPPELAAIRARLARFDAWCRARADLEVLPPSPPPWTERLPVLALRPRAVPPEVLVQALAQGGLDVRAGTMCTSRVLPSFGLSGGVVRFSPAPETEDAEFEAVRALLEQCLDELVP